jgi:hypothetical protein
LLLDEQYTVTARTCDEEEDDDNDDRGEDDEDDDDDKLMGACSTGKIPRVNPRWIREAAGSRGTLARHSRFQ